MSEGFMNYDLRIMIFQAPGPQRDSGENRQNNGGRTMGARANPEGIVDAQSSIRSAMSIARTLQMNQAPSGAACLSGEVPGSPMPLLTELGKRVVGPRTYKHGAPDGAFPSALFASLRFRFAHLPIVTAPGRRPRGQGDTL